MAFGSLSAMCTASGDVGWFSIKHKSQGQNLYVKHGTSVQRRGFWQADLHHAQYRCIHTHVHRHQINKWCVTKSIWRQRSKQQYLEVWIEDACCWLGHYSNYAFYSNYMYSVNIVYSYVKISLFFLQTYCGTIKI